VHKPSRGGAAEGNGPRRECRMKMSGAEGEGGLGEELTSGVHQADGRCGDEPLRLVGPQSLLPATHCAPLGGLFQAGSGCHWAWLRPFEGVTKRGESRLAA
jgi:hypothetical protein